MKANIKEGREKSETLLEKLKAILEGTDLNIAEIRKEAFDFGRFLIQSENGRTGKYDADKLEKYIEDKLRQKQAHIGKLMLKNVSLKAQIMKAEKQIKHKQEMNDDLKFIDFHQLQIENKKHVKDIDERNRKLVKLKKIKGNTDSELDNLKGRLAESEKMRDKYKRNIEAQEKSMEETKVQIQETKKQVEDLEIEEQKLEAKKQRTKDMPEVKHYVEEKKNEKILLESIKNWKRKIEIAEIAAKEARRRKLRRGHMPQHEMM